MRRSPFLAFAALGLAAVTLPAAASATLIDPWATAGAGTWGVAVDATGNVLTANNWTPSDGGNNVTKVTPAGVASTLASMGATIAGPTGIAVDSAGNAFVTNNVTDTVSKITPAGVISTFATTGDQPWGIAIDPAGNLYVSNSGGNSVTKITPAGVTTTFAGVGAIPRGIAVDTQGNAFVATQTGVTKITPAGVASTFATLADTTNPPSGPNLGLGGRWGITVDWAGNVYTAEVIPGTVTKITPAGTASTLASLGATSRPTSLTIDSAGNVYTTNFEPSTVSKITPDGAASTLATLKTYNAGPRGIAIDASANLFIGIAGNTGTPGAGAVAKVSPGGGTADIAPAPPAIPPAPTATAGVESATVSVTNPVDARYGAPSTYVVTAVSDASKTCTITAPATSCVVPALAAGTAYTFTATAKLNSWVTPSSAASNQVTTPTTPAAASQGRPTVTPNAVVAKVRVERPGTVILIGSSRARGRWVTRCVGRQEVTKAPATVNVACKLTPVAKRLLCRGPLQLRLITRLVSPGYPPSSSTRTVRVAGRSCGTPRVTG